MHRLQQWWLDRHKVTASELSRLQENERLASLNAAIESEMSRSERAKYIAQWWGKAQFELGRMRGSTRRR